MAEETAVLDETVVDEAIDEGTPESDTPEASQSQESTQPAQSQSEKEAELFNILEKEKADPRYVPTKEEQLLYDEYVEGKLKPSKGEAKDSDKKDEKTEKDTKKDEKTPEEIEKLMKEVGAKTPKEVVDKVKELRKAISKRVEESPEFVEVKGDNEKLATGYKALKTQWDSHLGFMSDVQKGNPEAIKVFEKTFGVKIATTSEKAPAKPLDDDDLIDNSFLKGQLTAHEQKMMGLIEAQNKELKDLKDQNQKRIDADTKVAEERSLVDEMVNVAANIPALKEIPNFRLYLNKWRANELPAEEMTRMDDFYDNLFKVGNEKSMSLEDALFYLRGKQVDLLVEQAKQDGKKAAYNQKPNPTLSGLQGSKNEQTTYTDADVQNMLGGKKAVPDEWLTKEGNPDREKIPTKYHKHFW